MPDRVAAYLVVLILALSATAVFLQSRMLDSYKGDIKYNYDYCYTGKGATEHQDSKDCQSFLYKATDDPIALFTGGLFAFTIALAIATIRLFQVTKKGLADQEALMRSSLQHTDRSAKAAENAIVGLNRPYVFPVIFRHNLGKGLTTMRMFLGTSPPRIVEFSYKNFGKTPAIIKQTAFHPHMEPIVSDLDQTRRRSETNPAFNNIQAQTISRAWVLGDGANSETVPVALNMPDFAGFPPQARQMLDEMLPHLDRPSNLFLKDRIIYVDLAGNEYVLVVEYRWDSQNFVLTENSETQTKNRSV